MLINNNKLILNSCQALSSKKINKYIGKLPKKKKAVLFVIHKHGQKYIKNFPKRQTIASMVKQLFGFTVNLDYISSVTSEFQQAGILLKTNLLWRSTLYELHPYLYSKQFRKIADSLLPEEIRKRLKTPKKNPRPIKSLSSTIFINKPVPSVQLVLTKKVVSKENKKKGKKVVMIEQVKVHLNLSDDEVKELSIYNDVILKRAYEVLRNTQKREKVDEPFRYLRGTCKRLLEKEQNKPVLNQKSVHSSNFKKIEEPKKSFKEQQIEGKLKIIKQYEYAIQMDPDTVLPKKFLIEVKAELEKIRALPENEEDTPVRIANGIYDFMDGERLKKVSEFRSMEEAVKLRDSLLKRWLMRDLVFKADPTKVDEVLKELGALEVINKYRNIYKLPLITQDFIQGRYNTQEVQKDSSQVKLDPVVIESNSLENNNNQYFIL